MASPLFKRARVNPHCKDEHDAQPAEYEVFHGSLRS